VPQAWFFRYFLLRVEGEVWRGRRIRRLKVVDDCIRESIVMEVNTSISGERVARVLDRIAEYRSLPKMIRVDHEPEFTGLALNAWAYARGVKPAFIQPGKPTQDAYIESFNWRFRDECLNDHWFLTIYEARVLIEAWRQGYISARSHSFLAISRRPNLRPTSIETKNSTATYS
jgi:putative transposase